MNIMTKLPITLEANFVKTNFVKTEHSNHISNSHSF